MQSAHMHVAVRHALVRLEAAALAANLDHKGAVAFVSFWGQGWAYRLAKACNFTRHLPFTPWKLSGGVST